MSRNTSRRRQRGATTKLSVTSTSVKQKVLDEIKRGGQIIKHHDTSNMSNEDIRIAIKGTEVALAYLEGRGSTFDLASTALRLDLLSLEQYRDMRKQQN